jgi:hypothetical protein
LITRSAGMPFFWAMAHPQRVEEAISLLVPSALALNLKHNGVLHERLLLLKVTNGERVRRPLVVPR